VIVVDTSVWVAAIRRPLGPLPSTLRALLDADEVALALPVRLELMCGIKSRDRERFRRALSALPVAVPTEDTWRIMEQWVVPAADRGHRFAVSDLLIAGLASELGGLVWSLDADFARMEALGMVQCYQPPGGADDGER
jgi:predicted nucleic acid-binding protein